MYKPYFSSKIDECVCGRRLSTKQKRCPRCKTINPDYRPRNWVGGVAGIEENIELEKDNSAGPYEEYPSNPQ